jgi:predicted CXXCH cytochrome family protein
MSMRIKTAAIILLLAAVQATAADKKVNCLKCHSKVKQHKVVHGPLNFDGCRMCHAKEVKVQGSKVRHTFELAAPQPQLCFQCHEVFHSKFNEIKNKHGAIEAGGCTSCHDPHGSNQALMLKGESMNETCAQCHDDKLKAPVVHAPAEDSCANCHTPHGSDRPSLLKIQPPQLCVNCHEDMQTELAGKVVHGPVQVGCAQCHNPHSAQYKGLFQKDGKKDLCLSCHVDVGKYISDAEHPHNALNKEKGCAECHNPHTSDQPLMLRKELSQLCLSCHKEMRAELSGNFKHGPVKMNQCQGCHNPHGAKHEKILKVKFPTKFYNEYQSGLYTLCFTCHESDIARDEKTLTLTNFRNGDRNLHFVHVNAEKGRSCKACHAVHSSDQKRHIRKGVPFGSWMLPIEFQATANGGGCTVGCHTPKSYDRIKPVKYE